MSKPLSTILYLRINTYHKKKLSLDLEKFPPTSNTIRFHILRTHFQAYIWYCAPIKRSINIAPETYGYVNDDDELVPIITDEDILLEKLPMPCNRKKCKSDKTCVCRKNDLPCPECYVICNCNAANMDVVALYLSEQLNNNFILYTREINFSVHIYIFCPPIFFT